jgi:hypothetical protein
LKRNYFFFSSALGASAGAAAALAAESVAAGAAASGAGVASGAGAASGATAVSAFGASPAPPPQDARKRPIVRAKTLSFTNFINFCFKVVIPVYTRFEKR